MKKKKMSNTKITVIIPVHELDDKTKPLLKKALESVVAQKVAPEGVVVVGPKEIKEALAEVTEGLELKVKHVINKGKTDFSSQLNLGVEKMTTSHFTLLELDDELLPIWIDNAKKYLEAYPEVDMFLPIVINTDTEGNFQGFMNEPVWASEFSDKMGELDTECLLAYTNFNFDGMVMSGEKYIEFGSLKPSMKLTFPYEFMLRVTHHTGKIMVIPKFGYKHANLREDSLFDLYKKNMSLDEQRWWLALAKKEYFHTNDRKITYEREEG